jgi:hypothetical protein
LRDLTALSTCADNGDEHAWPDRSPEATCSSMLRRGEDAQLPASEERSA